jgi:hypothetical protein
MTRIVPWVFILLSVTVMFITFPLRSGRILVPEFLPRAGVPFAVAYIGAQCALVGYLRSRRGILLVTGIAILGMVLGAAGRAVDLRGAFARYEISYLQYVLSAGASASGLALGIALARDWVTGKE